MAEREQPLITNGMRRGRDGAVDSAVIMQEAPAAGTGASKVEEGWGGVWCLVMIEAASTKDA